MSIDSVAEVVAVVPVVKVVVVVISGIVNGVVVEEVGKNEHPAVAKANDAINSTSRIFFKMITSRTKI